MQLKTGPFLRSPLTIKQIMVDVLIALTPCVVAGIIFFGWPALRVLVLSSVSAVLTEALLTRAPLTPKGIFGDCSALVTGLLVGLILPPTTAWWIPVIGSILAIALVKLAFGGLGHNIFNPALGARAILLLAFTSQMVKFVVPFDTVTGATPLLSTRSFSWSLVWGNVGGSIGETSVIAILLGAIYLIYKGHINWRNPVGYIGSAFVLALIWGLDPWYTITAGGLLFAAVFMATDMVTSPVTPMGQLIFGIGCGVLTLVIRQFTSLPEGVTFAVLTMNALAPAIESLTIPRIFGLSISQETRMKGIAVTAAAAVILVGVFVALDSSQPAVAPVISHGQHLPIAELLSDENYEVVEENGTRYYLVRDEEGNPLQVAFIAEQGGFNAPIRFLVVLDQEHKIQTISVLEHKEDPGLGELITRPSFLEQFVGLDKDSSFGLGADIQAVSGATISSRALASGVSRALEAFDVTFFGTDEVGGWSDGTYRAQADSFGGNLEVEVVVAGGKIASVEVVSHADTPGISDPAISSVPEQIVAANSYQVDGVSGATVTSQAIMKAVQTALEQAVTEAAGETASWQDGNYTGQANSFGGKLELEVVVAGGKISAVNILSHSDTPGISDPAFSSVPESIVAANSPKVDIASGATVSSEAIMEAVQNALEKATGEAAAAPAVEPYNIVVADGVYRSSAQGFGGEVALDVTISGGKITEIEVLENEETPFIANNAFKELIPAIIETQGPVDVRSGATVTSNAILEAVEKAVSGGAVQAEADSAAAAWVDGTYTGKANSFGGALEVEVVVSGGKISAVNVLSHSDTPGISDPAMNEIPERIVAANSPEVDTSSGATVSSKAIIEAVQTALEKATGEATAVEPYQIQVEDGVYRSSAQGFGGELVLDVTISGGKISEIEVVESEETPFIANNAFKELLPGIIETQGPVDVRSGATVTSNAILEAVEKAVSGGAVQAEADSAAAAWVDGTYTGKANSFGGALEVEVVVSGGKISAVNVLSHSDTPGISDPAMSEIPERIVAANSPEVDTSSGATVSSKAIIEAVQTALEKANGEATAVEPYQIQVEDGVYRSSAQGFGGELVLDVTISGGKISEIEVVESEETPFIANNAFKELLPGIIETQGPVDVRSGATVTSNAILEAVQKAVSGEAVQAEVAADAWLDGTYTGKADSFGGTLEVEVVVADGKISVVNVVSHSDTPGISDPAMSEIPERIVAANSPEVDTASGATVSSKAIIEAVQNALSVKEGQ